MAVIASAFVLGLAYANLRAEVRLGDRLSEALEGQEIQVSGVVSDLPGGDEHGRRFILDVDKPADGVPSRLSLSWHAYAKSHSTHSTQPTLPVVRAGERWLLNVKLLQPHGNMNPSGFDYEGWMFERGIGGVGHVREGAENRRLERRAAGVLPLILSLRESIRDNFNAALPDSLWRGVLVALVVGDQASITKQQWTTFARTGVSHLISISGLHVTLVGAMFALCVGFAWRRFPVLLLRMPVQKVSVLAGALSAGAYVLLAGGGVPAQRTFYMLVVAACALWMGRANEAMRTLLLALFVVLLIDPWAVLSAGFWLSFGAVGALMLMSAAVGGEEHWLRGWLRAQWTVTVFTLPVLLALFQQFSVVSPIANAIAIPVVSAIITPLALLFAAIPYSPIAQLANWLMSWLGEFLQWLGAVPFASWQQAAPPGWLVIGATLAAAWSLLPKGVPARWLGPLSLIPLLAWQPPRPTNGEAEVTVLDVGQGLSVHVRTAHHDMLYDAGPQYSPTSDSGERLIVPYLRASGTTHVDRIVISHDDSDHNGGAESVAAAVPVTDWWLGQPFSQAPHLAQLPFTPCVSGERWVWDGVRFEVLHPDRDSMARSDNDHSCVLRVVTAGGAVLLPGDIEKVAEGELLAHHAKDLAADIIVAPHHGSKSSSHEDFIKAVGASVVVYANGYKNRFHHPAPSVVERYAAAGTKGYRSDVDGAVKFSLRSGGFTVETERSRSGRYWHDETY